MTTLSRLTSPNGALTLLVERLDDGDVLIGLDGFAWHTHPDLLVPAYGATEADAVDGFLGSLIGGSLVVVLVRDGATVVDAWLADDPRADHAFWGAGSDGTTTEFRTWDGTPWMPGGAG